MDDPRLGRLVRVMRRRRGWRQADLAARAGVGRSVISDLELGRISGMTLSTVRRVLAPFGASIEVSVRGLGADLDRVLDEEHARLLGTAATWLADLGWMTCPEVTYSEYGDRGSIDLLAWHPPSRTLLVVEVKTELGSIEATLRRHDEKSRLASVVAAKRFGWRPLTIARVLVLPESRRARRQVASYAGVLDRAYPDRTVAVRRWCASPVGPLAGLMFLSDAASSRTTRRQPSRGRVRLAGKSPV
jgi:transcriptional regulator with XRE-family HTH domain